MKILQFVKNLIYARKYLIFAAKKSTLYNTKSISETIRRLYNISTKLLDVTLKKLVSEKFNTIILCKILAML